MRYVVISFICIALSMHSMRSVIFLPRDATRKRGTTCRPVSVCLSVTVVYCIQTAKDIVKLLSPPFSF